MTGDVRGRVGLKSYRRTALTVVLVVLATLLAALGVVLACLGDQGATPETVTVWVVPSIATGEPVPSGRPSEAAGGADRGVLPMDLSWTAVAGVALPVSRRAGPMDMGAGLARGFTHDPAGAVLAAVHLLVRVSPQVGPAVFDPTLRAQVVGPDAAAMRDAVARDYASLRAAAGRGATVDRLAAELRGYRLGAFTTGEAAISVLTGVGDSRGQQVWAVTRVRMRWTGSDWALVAPPGGTFAGAVTEADADEAAEFAPFVAGG